MRLLRGAAAATIAKKVYEVARKPENQAKMREAAEKFRQRRAAGTAQRRPR